MIRASAKNFIRVAALVDPADYKSVADECRRSGGKISLETRFELSRKAFEHTARYDAAISEYLQNTAFARVKYAYPTVVE